MNYNVYTVVNSRFFELSTVWLNSLLAVSDLAKLDTIYIADTGLSEAEVDYLTSRSSKVEIIKVATPEALDSKDTHSASWHHSVQQKTFVCRHILEETSIPLVMVDADAMFLNDISKNIDLNYDVQVCKRLTPARSSIIKKPMEYLASYVSFNTPRALSFIEDWRETMMNLPRIEYVPNKIIPVETPALCKCISDYAICGNACKVGHIEEKFVSSYKTPQLITRGVQIIHFKSADGNSNPHLTEYEHRVNNTGWLEYANRYLPEGTE